MSIKHRRLKATIMAGILAFNATTVQNAYADAIGEGAYSWDRDWSITVSYDTTNPYETTLRTYLEYSASTGMLQYHSVWYDDEEHSSRHSYVTLGKGQDIFGEGITEDEIKDLISNVQGDQTVDGNQQVTGDQQVDGEQTVNGGQSVSLFPQERQGKL